VVPWLVWSGRATAALPAPLRDILGGYGGFVSDQVAREGGADAAVLLASAGQVGRGLVTLVVPGASAGLSGVLAVPVALVFACAAVALVRRSPVAGLALALLVIEVWLWPFQATRLLVPCSRSRSSGWRAGRPVWPRASRPAVRARDDG
jgi:hypothetical protein